MTSRGIDLRRSKYEINKNKSCEVLHHSFIGVLILFQCLFRPYQNLEVVDLKMTSGDQNIKEMKMGLMFCIKLRTLITPLEGWSITLIFRLQPREL